jgi:CRP-like cAMP-binding protein
MPHQKNELLARLSMGDFQHIEAHLKSFELQHGAVLANTHQPINSVYFPLSGIISCVVETKSGDTIETGMIGNDGVFGAGQAFDHKISLNKAVVQVPGVASVMDANKLREIADTLPSFRTLLIDYDQFFLGQVQQSAACNALHHVEPRRCRWLLRMHDLVGPDLPLTQDFLAQMMGVRRTSVTGVAIEMQKAGLISYVRGRMHIADIEAVRHRSCECEEDVREHHRIIFGARTNSTSFGTMPPVPGL